MATQYITCPNCRSQNMAGTGLCTNCGTALPQIGMPMQAMPMARPPGADKKIAAGICGILLGGLGIHKFILGYQNEGVIMLSVYLVGFVLSFFTCGITAFASLAIAVIGIIEGIMYLTKSDEEFVQTYVMNKKPWF